jgi:phage terminase large subunit-like protein
MPSKRRSSGPSMAACTCNGISVPTACEVQHVGPLAAAGAGTLLVREPRAPRNIVVAGKNNNGHDYVLADISGHCPPTEWARLAIAAYATDRADRIVAEVNNGGDMVGATLRIVDPNVAFTAVRASRGKMVRAEPVGRSTSRAAVRPRDAKRRGRLLAFEPEIGSSATSARRSRWRHPGGASAR